MLASGCVRLFRFFILLAARLHNPRTSLQSPTFEIRFLPLAPEKTPCVLAEHNRIPSFRRFRPRQIPRNTPERRPMRPVWKHRPVPPRDQRLRPHAIGPAMGANPIYAAAHITGKLNETRGGIGRRVSIPPSACIPPLGLCFAIPAPGREARENGAAHDTTLSCSTT